MNSDLRNQVGRFNDGLLRLDGIYSSVAVLQQVIRENPRDEELVNRAVTAIFGYYLYDVLGEDLTLEDVLDDISEIIFFNLDKWVKNAINVPAALKTERPFRPFPYEPFAIAIIEACSRFVDFFNEEEEEMFKDQILMALSPLQDFVSSTEISPFFGAGYVVESVFRICEAVDRGLSLEVPGWEPLEEGDERPDFLYSAVELGPIVGTTRGIPMFDAAHSWVSRLILNNVGFYSLPTQIRAEVAGLTILIVSHYLQG